MSVKHAISRGMELGRSAFQLGILKPAGRLAAKFRGERLRVSQPSRSVQPQTFLPARYRYYRMSLSGLAAQLQSGGFRRLIGGSPRNRVVFLAFGVGLGLIEQQLEDDRKSDAACQQIQVGSCVCCVNKNGTVATTDGKMNAQHLVPNNTMRIYLLLFLKNKKN